MRWLLDAFERFGRAARPQHARGNQCPAHRINRRLSWRLGRLEQLEERTLLSVSGAADDGARRRVREVAQTSRYGCCMIEGIEK